MILGITGGTGCGKTTLLQLIRQRGGLVLDCDEIYHQLLISDRALLEALHQRFPLAFSDGSFDRKKLGSIVFADAQALRDLNSITHSAVRQEVERRLEDAPPLAAIDAIGLFESGLNRLVQRDSISPEYARSRIAAQPSPQWFSSRCDAVLENNGTAEEFRKKSIAFLDSHGIIKTVCSG